MTYPLCATCIGGKVAIFEDLSTGQEIPETADEEHLEVAANAQT